MDSSEILKSKQNIPEWKAGGLLSSTYKLPQGLSLIAAIRRDSAKKNMWKNVKYFKFSRHHRNFYWVQRRRLAFSNPSLSSLSQSLTCTASGWDGCFRVSPNSIRQMPVFSRFAQFLSWTFSSKFYKTYLVDVPRLCVLWGWWQLFYKFSFTFFEIWNK